MKKTLITLMTLVGVSSASAGMMIEETVMDNGEVSVIITDPIYPVIGVSISSNSSQNGICRLYGYEKSVPDSLSLGDKVKTAFAIDDLGNVSYADKYIDRVGKIICLNKKEQEVKFKEVVSYKNPSHADSGLSLSVENVKDNSMLIGICKYLGHNKVVPNGQHTANKEENVLVLDKDGLVIKKDYKYPISEIFCFNE